MDDVPLIDTRSSLKAVCSRQSLWQGLQTVAHAVSTRTTMDILKHVHVQSEGPGLRLSATDSELSITTVVAAEVVEPGALTAPARMLTELLGALPDREVEVSVDRSNAVRVNCERSNYKLLGLAADQFPSLPVVRDDTHFSIRQKDLREAIRRSIFAVSPEETRRILSGILLVVEDSAVRFVATDTHRLTFFTVKLAEGTGTQRAIVPARTMTELLRVLSDDETPVGVSLTDRLVRFSVPGREAQAPIDVVSLLIEGQFPTFERVIPTGWQRRLTLQTGPLQAAARRASVMARASANRIILRTLDEKLTITAESSQDGAAYEEVEVVREGDDVEVALNVKYLLDVLGVLDEEGFYLEITEALKPMLLRPAMLPDSPFEYMCVLMPMQIT